MSRSTDVIVQYLGESTGPNEEILAAEPYETFGVWLLCISFLVFFVATLMLAFKKRTRGSLLILLGLLVIALFYLFQNTLAQDAELKYGPWAEAVSYVAYGCGSFLFALGYARHVWSIIFKG